ncbi:hypothetical protein EPI10_030642 [Gossypium australe]|uniref:Uncharacterized protein n=1 Tax=Gossypium australe TaxID=47621 RepID=A0A5B6WZD4_9ROSI|nr:hypothetical protein EPI10_030642 [Gossypium australe]
MLNWEICLRLPGRMSGQLKEFFGERLMLEGRHGGSTFNEDTAKKILEIPLAETIYDDFQGPSNNFVQTEIRNFYRKLWNLQLPPKISWNYIPTLSILKNKKVAVELFVPVVTTPMKIVITFSSTLL